MIRNVLYLVSHGVIAAACRDFSGELRHCARVNPAGIPLLKGSSRKSPKLAGRREVTEGRGKAAKRAGLRDHEASLRTSPLLALARRLLNLARASCAAWVACSFCAIEAL